jgi:hypothetical protein
MVRQRMACIVSIKERNKKKIIKCLVGGQCAHFRSEERERLKRLPFVFVCLNVPIFAAVAAAAITCQSEVRCFVCRNVA